MIIIVVYRKGVKVRALSKDAPKHATNSVVYCKPDGISRIVISMLGLLSSIVCCGEKFSVGSCIIGKKIPVN